MSAQRVASPAHALATNATASETTEGNDTVIDGSAYVEGYLPESNGSTLATQGNDTADPQAAPPNPDDFQVYNSNTDQWMTVTADLQATTNHAYIYVEQGQSLSQSTLDEVKKVTDDSASYIKNDLDAGFPDVDGRSKVFILIMDIPDPPDANVLGYFRAHHETNAAHSNQREMVFLDAADISNNIETIPHELTHLSNYKYDGSGDDLGEETWLAEGLAQYTQNAVFPGTTIDSISQHRLNDYERKPSEVPVTWQNYNPDLDARYGSAYLFTWYLYEHYGRENIISAVLKNTDHGTSSITDSLRSQGYSTAFESVYRDWIVANYLDDPSIAPEYGYSTIDVSVAINDTSAYSGGTISNQYIIEHDAVQYLRVTPLNLAQNQDGIYFGVSNGAYLTPSIRRTASGTAVRTRVVPNGIPFSPPITANNTVANFDRYRDLVVPVSALGASGGSYEFGAARIPDDHTFSNNLDGGESAAYAIPVNIYGSPNTFSKFEPNGRPFVTVWSNDPGSDLSVSMSSPSGGRVSDLATPPGAMSVGTLAAPSDPGSIGGAWKAVIEQRGQGGARIQVATNYLEGSVDSNQVFSLPSELSLAMIDAAAGNNDDPGQVTINVTVETGDDPYVHSPFDSPDASHFDVSVGGKQVASSRIAVTELREDKYRLRFTPPTQPSSGTYDLSVKFTDEKFGVSHTASETLPDAVKYGGTGSTGAASVALILDRSGSMGFTKMSDAKQAAKIFITDQLRDSDYATVVSYSSASRVDVPIMRVGGNRLQFTNAIDAISSSGSTNIGAGLIDARDQLDAAPDVTSKAAILLTDGNNNAGFSDAQVVQIADTYDARGYCVYTIAFGTGADERLLRRISDQTCGSFFQAATGANLRSVYRDLRQITTGESTIYSDTGEVPPAGIETEPFSVDDSTDRTTLSVTVGAGTTTTATGNATAQQSGSTRVLLRYPNGTLLGLNSSSPTGTEDPDIVYTQTGDTTTYRMEDPQPGNWSYTIQNQGTSQVSFQATATASTSTTLDVVTDANTYVNGSTATLSATLLNSSGGVTGADVRANVTRPDGTTTVVRLTEQSPGQYSGDLTLRADGDYSARVIADAGTVHRETTVTWSVIDQSSLLRLSQQGTAPSIAQGGDVTVNLSVSRPSTGTTTSARSVDADFDAAARELARESRERIESSNASPAVKAAALALKDEASRENVAVAQVAPQAGVSGTKTVYLRTTQLAGPNGTTIPASRVSLDVATLSLAAGEGRNVTATVSVPGGVEPGRYTGSVKAIVSGTVIAQNVTVNVTKATRQTYVKRIRNAARQWQGAGPSLQRFYEGRMVDHLASIYFALNASTQQRLIARSQAQARANGTTLTYAPGSGPASEVWQNAGTTYTHELSVETNASGGPLVFAVFYEAGGNVTLANHTATLGGEPLRLDATTDTRTINGQQFTEVRFVNRSVSTNGTETLHLRSNLTLGHPGGRFHVTTGGLHGPSGAVLPQRKTTLTATSLEYYAGSDRIVNTDDLRQAITNWISGHISTGLLQDVMNAWIRGTTV